MSEAGYLKEQAQRCRRLADGISDQRAVHTLRQMADDFERRATALESQPEPKPPLAD